MPEKLTMGKEALYHSVPNTKEVAEQFKDPESTLSNKPESREARMSAVIASLDKIEKQVKAELGARARVLNLFQRAGGDTIGVGHFFENIKSKIESYKKRTDVEEFTADDLKKMLVAAKEDNYQGALGARKGTEKNLKLVYISSEQVNRSVDGTGRV